jgi:hypothetical protein
VAFVVADFDTVIIPSNESDYVELAHVAKAQGRVFKKHILSRGILHHPATGEKISVDDKFVNELKANFSSKVCPIVQFPLADANNKHSEDPLRNAGEVIEIQDDGNKVYAIIDVRDPLVASKIGDEKTLLGASAMISTNYTDTSTNKKVGAALLHACGTNRPYLTDLDDYEEIIAASSANNGDPVVFLTEALTEEAPEKSPESSVSKEFIEKTIIEFLKELENADKSKETDKPLTEGNMPETLEELLTKLKAEHNIDVPALQASAEEGVKAQELSATLSAALGDAGIVKLSNGEQVTPEEVVGAVSELAEGHLALTAQVKELVSDRAKDEVQNLIKAGRVLPAQETAMVELCLSNRSMFDAIVPAEPIIKLTTEVGVESDADDQKNTKFAEEIARLTAPGGPASQYVRQPSRA